MLRVSIAFVSLVWAASAAAQTGELHLVQELRLGRVDGSGPDVFADIHDLAIDSFGRIYVLDPGWKDVRLFDREGRFIRRLAPEGDGPGERRHRPQFPARVTWDAGRARLWIDDRRFLSVVDSLGAEYSRDTHVPSLRERGSPTGAVVAVDKEGRVYEQQYRVPGDSVYSYVARGRDTTGYLVSGDTLHLDTRALVQRGSPRTDTSGGNTMTITFLAPERDHIVWSISPEGTVWLADLREPRLHEVSIAGDTLGTLDIPRKDLAELDISPEGWIWARRVAEPDEPESIWDVLDNCGVYLGSASVPYAVTVTEVGSAGVIHVVASGHLDIEHVARLRLDTETSRRSC